MSQSTIQQEKGFIVYAQPEQAAKVVTFGEKVKFKDCILCFQLWNIFKIIKLYRLSERLLLPGDRFGMG